MTNDPLDAMKARWNHIQGSLFPWFREVVDPMTEALGRLVTILDVIGLEAFVPEPPRGAGRPPEDRRALADRARARWADRRGHRARRHRDRGTREADQERAERQKGRPAARWRAADTQARTPTQGRGTAKARADAARTADHAEPRSDARRSTHRVRCRLQEEQQRLQGNLDRLQTASGCRLRPNPGL